MSRYSTPGQVVPRSGVYRCSSEDGHVFESTDVKGHRFPPLPRDCPARGGCPSTADHP
ncbi:hypothetical protein [Geodermatophilus sabuli]|uniref:hypothetical protein n=1 Tax=Geodermatophilus sabuli TaxID=1564158 RepID=UPI00155886B6|nr:hypothetical protein [Geodermatophilus sabuli]MBB3083780.1 hypothetical protein [Geodermatophilus sabuli]